MTQNNTLFAGELKRVVESIERLEEEKRTIASDIKEIYDEAKGAGFDAGIIRRIVALRRKDPAERTEEEAVLETYLNALGMV